jgi:hypothetical protein
MQSGDILHIVGGACVGWVGLAPPFSFAELLGAEVSGLFEIVRLAVESFLQIIAVQSGDACSLFFDRNGAIHRTLRAIDHFSVASVCSVANAIYDLQFMI